MRMLVVLMIVSNMLLANQIFMDRKERAEDLLNTRIMIEEEIPFETLEVK